MTDDARDERTGGLTGCLSDRIGERDGLARVLRAGHRPGDPQVRAAGERVSFRTAAAQNEAVRTRAWAPSSVEDDVEVDASEGDVAYVLDVLAVADGDADGRVRVGARDEGVDIGMQDAGAEGEAEGVGGEGEEEEGEEGEWEREAHPWSSEV